METTADPLGNPATITLPLTAEQCAVLGSGQWFIAVGMAHHPHPHRMSLLALPVPKEIGDAACRVAMGQAKATRIIKPTA